MPVNGRFWKRPWPCSTDPVRDRSWKITNPMSSSPDLVRPMIRTTLPIFALLAALISPPAAVGQAAPQVTGTIRSQGGAPIPAARITFAPGGMATETDWRGRFRLEVPAGTVGVLELAAVGFTPERLDLPAMTGGQQKEVAATLRPLFLLDALTVVARRERPLLDTRDATTGGAVEAREIAALPTDARDPIALLYNIPGVAQATSYFGDAPTLSFNGANSLSTQYTVDGLDDNEGFLGGQRVSCRWGPSAESPRGSTATRLSSAEAPPASSTCKRWRATTTLGAMSSGTGGPAGRSTPGTKSPSGALPRRSNGNRMDFSGFNSAERSRAR